MTKLLHVGKIPDQTVGKLRRVRFDDLRAYQQKDDEEKAKVLSQFIAEAHKLGMATERQTIPTITAKQLLSTLENQGSPQFVCRLRHFVDV